MIFYFVEVQVLLINSVTFANDFLCISQHERAPSQYTAVLQVLKYLVNTVLLK